MRPRLRREPLYTIEIDDHEFRKSCEREWIQGLFIPKAGKIAQAQRAQLELFSLFCRR